MGQNFICKYLILCLVKFFFFGSFIIVIFVILALLNLTDEPYNLAKQLS